MEIERKPVALRRSPSWVPGEGSSVGHVTLADNSAATSAAVRAAAHPDEVAFVHWLKS